MISPRFRRYLLVIAAAYVLVCALMYIQQRRFLYFPLSGPTLPQEVGLLGFTDKKVGELRFWEDTPSDEPILIYLHGNGGGLFAFVPALDYLARHFQVLALEYPGYPRGAPGSPTERAIMRDALALFDHARKTYPDRPIILWGYSLGSGVAVQLAAQRQAEALVLEAPFTAVVDRAGEMFPYLPTKYLMRDRYLSRAAIGNSKAPLIIIHGTEDMIVPIAHGEALFALANEPKQFERYEGANHFDLQHHGAYDDAIGFIGQAIAR